MERHESSSVLLLAALVLSVTFITHSLASQLTTVLSPLLWLGNGIALHYAFREFLFNTQPSSSTTTEIKTSAPTTKSKPTPKKKSKPQKRKRIPMVKIEPGELPPPLLKRKKVRKPKMKDAISARIRLRPVGRGQKFKLLRIMVS